MLQADLVMFVFPSKKTTQKSKFFFWRGKTVSFVFNQDTSSGFVGDI